MTDKEQIIIDTNKYFVEIIDESRSTIGYNVVRPERLLMDIIKQNKQLISKTQECEELKAEKEVIKKYLGISDKSIMQRLEELTEYKLKRQLKYIKIEEERDRYHKALEEIEGIIQAIMETNRVYPLKNNLAKILNIINKAEGDN